MDLEKLLQKKISRKDFLKSLGFILLAIVFFPRKALSFINDNSYLEKKVKQKDVEKKSYENGIDIDGVKAIEIIDK